jgi:hypothetical protein
MKRPPMMMHVKVQSEEKNFGLWLPLFLLIPLALVVLIILSPLLFVVFLIWPDWAIWGLKVLWAAFESFTAMRGLEVDVQDNRRQVHVSVV